MLGHFGGDKNSMCMPRQEINWRKIDDTLLRLSSDDVTKKQRSPSTAYARENEARQELLDLAEMLRDRLWQSEKSLKRANKELLRVCNEQGSDMKANPASAGFQELNYQVPTAIGCLHDTSSLVG